MEEEAKLKLVHSKEPVRQSYIKAGHVPDWKAPSSDPLQDIKDWSSKVNAESRRRSFRTVQGGLEANDDVRPSA